MGKFIISNLILNDDNTLTMTYHYCENGQVIKRLLPNDLTIGDVFDEIQKENIEIEENANNYKWSFILTTITNPSLSTTFDYNAIKERFISLARYLRDNGKKYIISYQSEVSRLKKKLYINNNCYSTPFINKADKYGLWEGTVKALSLKTKYSTIRLNEVK